jgi:dihydrofolate reductase
MRIALIVAMGRNRVIGLDGALPWRLASDLAFFRATTMGKPVVMGRKTWVSIGRPLPGRHNIVVSRDPALPLPEGVERAADLDQALRLAEVAALRLGADEIMAIGGAEIYAQALPRAACVHCTEVAAEPEGDALFPVLDPAEWCEVAREARPAGPKDDHDFALVRYDRRR